MTTLETSVTGSSSTGSESRRAIAIALLRESGVVSPEQLVDLAIATSSAEKDGSEVTQDPLTGRWFDAFGLMDQLEREGRDRLGREFSERRGYSQAQIAQFEAFLACYHTVVAAGAAEDDVAFALGVADGQLDPPDGLSPPGVAAVAT